MRIRPRLDRKTTLMAGGVIVVALAALLTVVGAERGALYGYTIVIDPGHGDHDRGVCHFPKDLIEKEINLDMAHRLQRMLRAQGALVALTRTDDTFLSLDERAEIANDLKADFLISIHTNRIPKHPECFGAQTFYHPSSDESKMLAITVQEALREVDPENYRQALPGDYRVLRRSAMPSILVEVGFLTNARDRSLIATSKYRDDIALGVVAGLVRYLEADRAEP